MLARPRFQAWLGLILLQPKPGRLLGRHCLSSRVADLEVVLYDILPIKVVWLLVRHEQLLLAFAL